MAGYISQIMYLLVFLIQNITKRGMAQELHKKSLQTFQRVVKAMIRAMRSLLALKKKKGTEICMGITNSSQPEVRNCLDNIIPF